MYGIIYRIGILDMTKIKKLFYIIVLAVIFITGCSGEKDSSGQSEIGLSDGEYMMDVTLKGGSGRAEVESPSKVRIEDGIATAQIIWSSSNYDYMLVDGEKHLPVNEEGNSVFEIPVATFDSEIEVIADTTAMSKPHEIEYTLYFDSSSATEDAKGDSKSISGGEGNPDGADDSLDTEAPKISGLHFLEEVSLDYAECFRIYRYEGDYSLICVDDGSHYLIVPEDGNVPEGLPEDYTVLKRQLDRIYLAATAVMSLFDSVDALREIRFSGTEADGWYIDNAKAAMEKGDILFAGKYSEPDYELLLSEGCDLAIESTMILHSPDVREKLETLGIPVMVDRSSYESEPLGRTEWIKLYGELTGQTAKAEEYFKEQKAYVKDLADFENTGKTVAFFYINESGMIVTRKTSDYVPKMIGEAGGKYIFDALGDEENASSGVTMSMEEFYATAVDADYLIYNATIENPLDSVNDLLEKSSLFADFKAVKDGNVWCTGKYLYQATDVIGSMIQDIHTMLTDDSAEELSFMVRLH